MSAGLAGFADRPLSDDQLRDALAASLGIDPSGLALLSGREAAAGLARLRALQGGSASSTSAPRSTISPGCSAAAPASPPWSARSTAPRRVNESRLVVAFVDVDGLKRVNDDPWPRRRAPPPREGGDRVLRTRPLRSYDLVMRWGGDEFVCALYGAEPAGAERRMDAVAAGIVAATREGR